MRTKESIYDKLRVKEFGGIRKRQTNANKGLRGRMHRKSQRLTEIQTHEKVNVPGQEYYDKNVRRKQAMIAKETAPIVATPRPKRNPKAE